MLKIAWWSIMGLVDTLSVLLPASFLAIYSFTDRNATYPECVAYTMKKVKENTGLAAFSIVLIAIATMLCVVMRYLASELGYLISPLRVIGIILNIIAVLLSLKQIFKRVYGNGPRNWSEVARNGFPNPFDPYQSSRLVEGLEARWNAEARAEIDELLAGIHLVSGGQAEQVRQTRRPEYTAYTAEPSAAKTQRASKTSTDTPKVLKEGKVIELSMIRGREKAKEHTRGY